MCCLQKLVAGNVRSARARLGFTQKHLAGLARLSLSTLRDIETARRFPSAGSLERLSRALGLKPYKLLYDTRRAEIRDKHERITDYYRDLAAKINFILDSTTEKHLRAAGIIQRY